MSGRPLRHRGFSAPAEDPDYERRHHVPLVLGAAAMIGARPGHPGREVSRPLDAFRIERGADQRRRGLVGTDRRPADAGQGDARPGYYPPGSFSGHRDAHRGEVAYSALELEIAAAGRASRRRDDRLDGDLVVTERVLERTADEVDHRD